MGEAREAGKRWFEAVPGGDVAVLAALVTDGCDFVSPGGRLSDPHEIGAYVSGFAKAFPDASFEITSWVEAGATAVAEGVYRGTHTGPLASPMGEIPPTGRSVELPFVTVIEAQGGKLSVHRAYWDNAAFMGQLGLAPGP